MSSLSLKRPFEIFSNVLPSPPPCPRVASAPSEVPSMPAESPWSEVHRISERSYIRLENVLDGFGKGIRYVSRRKILWPMDESVLSTPREYLTTVLRPIVDIFNQLHKPGQNVLKTPMELLPLDLEEGIYAITFTAEDFRRFNVNPPFILFLPVDIFNPNGDVTPTVISALSRVSEFAPLVPTIIVTNLADITIFTSPRFNQQDHCFENVKMSQFSLTLRAISAALLHDVLPVGVFLQYPDLDGDSYILEGPPQNPRLPLTSDQEVFDSCNKLSDFDLVTVSRDQAQTLQLFRWFEHVRKEKSRVVRVGDELIGATNETGTFPPDIHPVFPFEFNELPKDTVDHIQTIQRKSPLVSGVGERLKQSRIFTVQILDLISEGSEGSVSSVYSCRITSIDGERVSSADLCLKLFDDRFQEWELPDEGNVEEFFSNLLIAPSLALNEVHAYNKLCPVQGSIVPWFYGIHQFTLPNGMTLSGLLMEYVRGSRLDSDLVRDSGTERQIKMIQSCRHACRVLDIADIYQSDWHRDQLLILTDSVTGLDHAVCFDFVFTSQTWDPERLHLISNYRDLFSVLRSSAVGIDTGLLWEYFGPPDGWDCGSVNNNADGDERITLKAADMFPFILFGGDDVDKVETDSGIVVLERQ